MVLKFQVIILSRFCEKNYFRIIFKFCRMIFLYIFEPSSLSNVIQSSRLKILSSNLGKHFLFIFSNTTPKSSGWKKKILSWQSAWKGLISAERGRSVHIGVAHENVLPQSRWNLLTRSSGIGPFDTLCRDGTFLRVQLR